MTRTARAAYPRAVLHDRHDSRSGLDTSLRKSGAGHHNWGSLANERELESAALEDGLHDEEEVVEPAPAAENLSASLTSSDASKPETVTSNTSLSEDELEKARQFRKTAFKKKAAKIDLTAIARTSAAVSSPRDEKMTRSISAGL